MPGAIESLESDQTAAEPTKPKRDYSRMREVLREALNITVPTMERDAVTSQEKLKEMVEKNKAQVKEEVDRLASTVAYFEANFPYQSADDIQRDRETGIKEVTVPGLKEAALDVKTAKANLALFQKAQERIEEFSSEDQMGMMSALATYNLKSMAAIVAKYEAGS